MRTLTVYQVRPQVDDLVDRPEVEVWQHMELTGTNRPRAYLHKLYFLVIASTVRFPSYGRELQN